MHNIHNFKQNCTICTIPIFVILNKLSNTTVYGLQDTLTIFVVASMLYLVLPVIRFRIAH